MPEPSQPTLSQQLTELIRAVLSAWEGPQPRLAYITDGGWHPADYFRRVLREMGDPRRPGQKLPWERVLDFYHACSYITQLAEALFGDTAQGRAWARRMRRLLRDEQRGASRVLQSAAYARNRQKLSGKRQEAYRKAHRYLQKRGRLMDYHGFKRRGLPIGSGATEAGCKTLFAQRLKQSGMRWGSDGGQVALDLRLLVLSGCWDDAFRRYLRHRQEHLNDTHTVETTPDAQNAA